MKVIQRGIMKMVPGKMAEAMQLNQKHMAIASRYGMPSLKAYRPFSGGGEYMHTIIFESEWDSLAAMEAFYDKAFADPEMQALMAQWDALLESHEIELYTPMT